MTCAIANECQCVLYAGGGICCNLKPQSSIYLTIKSALVKIAEDFTLNFFKNFK